MADNPDAGSFAAEQRRKYRHAEWSEQIRLTELLARHLPDGVFWTALENSPRSPMAGYLARKRGVRAGLADLMIVADGRVVFVEMKSPAGVPSPAQRQIAAELLRAGAAVWLARSARAALAALSRSGVRLRRRWREPRLRDWEGPFAFAGLAQRLPQHPAVAKERRAARQRWQERKRAREIAQRSDHPSGRTRPDQPAANDARQ